MTRAEKIQMVEEMKNNGYATQYSAEQFADWFTEEQLKKFKENFVNR